jgi:Flp pilus assembly protein TadG
MVDLIRLALAAARRFSTDDRGVAAVEMVLIAPVALLMLSVAVAGGQSLTLYHKNVLATDSITDLVSRTPYQKDNITNASGAELLNESDLDTDLMLSQMVYYPSNASNLKIVMSELLLNKSTNQGTVVWSEGCNGATALTVGSIINLDPSYSLLGASYLLYGQISNTFQPLGVTLSVPPITLNSTDILTIRNANSITLNRDSKTC